MSDTYQAVYDAVRSKISNADVGQAVSEAVNQQFSGACWAIEAIKHEFVSAGFEQQRPSVLYRPALSVDGNQWCALYGVDLQDGVAGFGESPAAAMLAFDAAWNKSLSDEGQS